MRNLRPQVQLLLGAPMTILSPDTKIEQLKKVGPAYLKRLYKLNIKTIRDLFFHFPHRYDDFRQIIPISQLKKGQTATISGKVSEITTSRTWKRKIAITEAIIQDNSGAIKVVWFNQPYLSQTLSKGKIINISGRVAFDGKALSFSNPAYEILTSKENVHTGRLIPVYHETAGLSSRYLRFLIKPLLYLTKRIEDFLPSAVKKEFQLMDLPRAIEQIHFPDSKASAQAAQKRLGFDELFLIQLAALSQKKELKKEKALKIPFNEELIKDFVKKLPFKLTNDQRKAAWQIFLDLEKEKPMNRLLNGDVGSGKTVVSAMTALEIAKAGYQAAIIAPTEILARQHFETFKNLLKETKTKIGLLTGTNNKESASNSLKTKKQARQGKIDILIGTHALIQKSVSFKNLALAIVDEQHRFGVAQRAALQKNISRIKDGLPTIPHLLSMTATPIPRTLALTVYGDLDISAIKEKPKGRQKIITKIVTPDKREETYSFIKKQVKEKKQVFVICPLIEHSEKLEVKSVTREYEKLSKEIFPDLKIDMLHGKMKPLEKEKIMEKFKKGKSDILVSTSVIEVGIDIKNASVMVIEEADRFGLAQLHQFRGRIGRGEDQSYCFLFTDSQLKKTNQRLKAIISAKDGFELAEKDLKIRGPGDFIGLRQWGTPDLSMASLFDIELIEKSRAAAAMVLEKKLLTPKLEKKINQFNKVIHPE